MILRSLLILLLVLPQMVLPAVWAGDCETTCCCTVVETTTCCGTIVQDVQCSKTGGDCLCAVDSTPVPMPVAPPITKQIDGTAPFLSLAPLTIEVPFVAPTTRSVVAPLPRRTHNEVQALLCIWRT